MQQKNINFYDWQQKYSTQGKCLAYIESNKWPDGFFCLHNENANSYYTAKRHHHECSECHVQTSIITETLFHGSKLPLTKGFWAIYWINSDKGGISDLRLLKLIDTTWRSAYRILKILRKAMGDRDLKYKLSGIIELDDAYIGGKKQVREVVEHGKFVLHQNVRKYAILSFFKSNKINGIRLEQISPGS